MPNQRDDPRMTSVENCQRLYDRLSESDKALITAWMNMSLALIQTVIQSQTNSLK